MKDLSNYPIIFPERGSATREYIINEFAKNDISLNTYVESENPSAIKHMVQLGMGGAFLPEFGIEEEAAEGKYENAISTLERLAFGMRPFWGSGPGGLRNPYPG